MKKVLCLLFIFLFIPVFLYFSLDRENVDINEFRLNSGYQELKLTEGVTSYKDLGDKNNRVIVLVHGACLLYTSPSPRDRTRSRMPSSA